MSDKMMLETRPYMKTRGYRMRRARENAGLTVQQVARMIGRKSHTSIVNYEANRGRPKMDDYSQLAQVLRTTVQALEGQSFQTSANTPTTFIRERVFTTGNPFATYGDEWGFPTRWLQEKGVMDVTSLFVFKVSSDQQIDTGLYSAGDVLIVDSDLTEVTSQPPLGTYMYMQGTTPRLSMLTRVGKKKDYIVVSPYGQQTLDRKTVRVLGKVRAVHRGM